MFGLRRHAAPALVADQPEDSNWGQTEGLQRATFAAGCFWGVEAAFREIKGVVRTTVGYTGGQTSNPTYRDVCRHNTGHAEAVEVWFDPSQLGYAELLGTFWAIHNPTTRNRQARTSAASTARRSTSTIPIKSPGQYVARPAPEATAQTDRHRGDILEGGGVHQRYIEKQGGAACAPSLQE
jgi:peptide-methionine (S)-S-oxide reductase